MPDRLRQPPRVHTGTPAPAAVAVVRCFVWAPATVESPTIRGLSPPLCAPADSFGHHLPPLAARQAGESGLKSLLLPHAYRAPHHRQCSLPPQHGADSMVATHLAVSNPIVAPVRTNGSFAAGNQRRLHGLHELHCNMISSERRDQRDDFDGTTRRSRRCRDCVLMSEGWLSTGRRWQ